MKLTEIAKKKTISDKEIINAVKIIFSAHEDRYKN